MVTQTHGDHLAAVSAADVQRAGLHVLRAKGLLLQVDNGLEGGDQGSQHLLRLVGPLPALRTAAHALRQERHVQGGQVLRVGGAVDVLVRGLLHEAEHGPADVAEVGDDAVVHEDVPAKDERVVVDRRHRRRRRGPDVRKHGRRRRPRADAVEVAVVIRRLAVFVHGRPHPLDAVDELRPHGTIPRHPEAIHVVQPVAQRDFQFRRLLARHVREQLRQVVVVHLFRDAMFLSLKTDEVIR